MCKGNDECVKDFPSSYIYTLLHRIQPRNLLIYSPSYHTIPQLNVICNLPLLPALYFTLYLGVIVIVVAAVVRENCERSVCVSAGYMPHNVCVNAFSRQRVRVWMLVVSSLFCSFRFSILFFTSFKVIVSIVEQLKNLL